MRARPLRWFHIFAAFSLTIGCTPATEGDLASGGRGGDGQPSTTEGQGGQRPTGRGGATAPTGSPDAQIGIPGAGGRSGAGGSLTAALDAALPATKADGNAEMPPVSPPVGDGGAPSFTSPNLPILMLSANGKTIPKGDKIPGVLKLILDHNGSHKDLANAPIALETPIGIDVRGKVSSGFPKKPYGIELRDNAGMDRGQVFLGLPKESDFALHSCYADVSCLRNNIMYALYGETGRYSVRTRYVEVFIEKAYNGLYLLVEKIKIDKNRVDLPKAAPTMAAGDITGGYIIRNEFFGNGKPTDAIPKDFMSKQLPIVYSYGSPKFDEITPEQKTYIHGAIDKFEVAMKAPTWADPAKGYPAFIDVPTWVDFAIFQELANNVDAYMKSQYIQKLPDSQGGKFRMSPVWDFDFAVGGVTFRSAQDTTAWAYKMNIKFVGETGPYPVVNGPAGRPVGTIPYVPLYWERLWSDPAFLAAVKCRWKELRTRVIDTKNINAKLDAMVKQLALAEPREHTKWPLPAAGMPRCCGFKTFATYAGYVDDVKTFLAKRIAFMDANLPGVCEK